MGSGLVVPELPAGPFRLRPFRHADVDLVRAAAQDPYIPLITTVPAVFTEGEGRRFIERQWSRAEQRTGYSFAIAEATTDQAVGQIGLWLRDVSQGRAEVGYWVSGPARGRGAAGHAVIAVTRWALSELGIREGLLRGWQAVGGVRKDMVLYSLLPADLAGQHHRHSVP
jgi:ribosomal-protein-alanine N-acetyltransferase